MASILYFMIYTPIISILHAEDILFNYTLYWSLSCCQQSAHSFPVGRKRNVFGKSNLHEIASLFIGMPSYTHRSLFHGPCPQSEMKDHISHCHCVKEKEFYIVFFYLFELQHIKVGGWIFPTPFQSINHPLHVLVT